MPQKPQRNRDLSSDKEQFPGQPGYRTRDGRTGLDPIDTAREAAFVEGRFYKALFTGKLRTRNRMYLAMMGTGAALMLSPAFCTLVEVFSGFRPTLVKLFSNSGPIAAIFVAAPMMCGSALIVNFVLSIWALDKSR